MAMESVFSHNLWGERGLGRVGHGGFWRCRKSLTPWPAVTSSGSGNIPGVPADQNLHDHSVQAQLRCVSGSHVSTKLTNSHVLLIIFFYPFLTFGVSCCVEQFASVSSSSFNIFCFLKKRSTGDGGTKWMFKVVMLFRKQCIESEKLFGFLKEPVDRATSTASKKDSRGVSVWPLYRWGSSNIAHIRG